jgi:hypothetical protein
MLQEIASIFLAGYTGYNFVSYIASLKEDEKITRISRLERAVLRLRLRQDSLEETINNLKHKYKSNEDNTFPENTILEHHIIDR